MDMYADLMLLLNFLVDFLLLYGTNKLTGFAGNGKRCVLGALAGSGYALLCILPGSRAFAGGLWPLGALVLVCGLSFGLSVSALRRAMVFFLLSMALAGLTMGLGSRGIWTVVLAGACLWLLCLMGFGEGTGQQYYSVILRYEDRKLYLTALADTGNTLRDPMTGKPVLVADERAAVRLGISREMLLDPVGAIGSKAGLRLIPYHSVGQAGGLLLAIAPAELRLNGKKADYLVAFSPNMLGNGLEALAGGISL